MGGAVRRAGLQNRDCEERDVELANHRARRDHVRPSVVHAGGEEERSEKRGPSGAGPSAATAGLSVPDAAIRR
jgi:hypothetical protein